VNDREIMEAAIRHMGDKPVPAQDDRPFLVRLFASLRAKLIGPANKPTGIEITGGTDF